MEKILYIIIHNVRSAYNVGSIFRTADGMGAQKIYLTGYTPFPFQEKNLYKTPAQKMISKTALGAEKNISWEKNKKISRVVENLKGKKFQIVALEQSEKSFNFASFEPKFPAALIVGSEPRGLSKKVLEKCDAIIEIPMRGKKNSLNVGVALGIAGYKLLN